MKKIIILIGVLCFTTTLFAQNYKFGKVSKAELEETSYPLDSTASAAYLYKFKNIYYEYDGAQGWKLITEVHERVKIYTKEGFDYANHRLNLYIGGSKEKLGGLKAYTFSLKNGKIKKEKMSKKGVFKEKSSKNWQAVKFTFPSIQEGVVLEYKYRIISPYITYIDDIVMQHQIPIKKIKVLVKIPEYFVFKKNLKGYLYVKITQKQKHRSMMFTSRVATGAVRSNLSTSTRDLFENVYTINNTDVPALKDEPYVSNINNYRSEYKFELSYIKYPNSLEKQYATSWEAVTKKIYESSKFGSELNKKRYYKNDLLAAIADAKSDYEKVAIIFRFVKSKVKWNGNYGKYSENGVKKAYKEGSGNVADINLMLTSMLRSANLNANPVLISTRENGVSYFPTIKGYNYVICSVVFSDNSYVLLDATEKFSVPNVLPTRTLNWLGRLVKKDGKSKTIPLEVVKQAVESNTISVSVTDDEVVEGIARSRFTNHYALFYRKKYNHLTEEELISKMEEKYSIEIDNFRVSNKKKLGKPISQIIKFSSEDLIENINGKLYITPLLFNALKTNPFKSEKRKFPVDFITPWKETNIVTIKIPEGYSVETIPVSKVISLTGDLGIFKYQVTATENTIKTISILAFNSAIITPEYYIDLKEFYKQVVEKQLEKIVLIKN